MFYRHIMNHPHSKFVHHAGSNQLNLKVDTGLGGLQSMTEDLEFDFIADGITSLVGGNRVVLAVG